MQIKYGYISNIDTEYMRVKVKLDEYANFETNWLQLLFKGTLKDKEVDTLDKETHVACILDDDLINGLCLGSTYSKDHKPPVEGKDKYYREFKDGTIFEYDRKEHKLNLTIEGDVNISINNSLDITAKDANTKLETWNISGNVYIDGELTVTKDITAANNIADQGGVSGTVGELREAYNGHTHQDAEDRTTSAPSDTV